MAQSNTTNVTMTDNNKLRTGDKVQTVDKNGNEITVVLKGGSPEGFFRRQVGGNTEEHITVENNGRRKLTITIESKSLDVLTDVYTALSNTPFELCAWPNEQTVEVEFTKNPGRELYCVGTDWKYNARGVKIGDRVEQFKQAYPGDALEEHTTMGKYAPQSNGVTIHIDRSEPGTPNTVDVINNINNMDEWEPIDIQTSRISPTKQTIHAEQQ